MVFTGIVEAMGTISAIVEVDNTWSGGAGFSVTIGDASSVLSDVHIGDSIMVSGVCLTVTEFDEAKTWFKVGIAPESIRKTNILDWKVGDKVNLERAMNAATRFGGHMIQGHVDYTVTMVSKTPDPPNSLILTMNVPVVDKSISDTDLLQFIVPKGYIGLNGTSLTVIDVDRVSRNFTVMLIAHTQEHVNLPMVPIGGRINLEVDEVGKYVDRVVRSFLTAGSEGNSEGGGWLEELVRKAVDRRVDEIIAAVVQPLAKRVDFPEDVNGRVYRFQRPSYNETVIASP
ncbi:hypothetical protein DFJ73DRAFT_844764 [Zopfochytrium polystomum]|nr:hypothetical protein DFJ73DRAFT_844764 [Zopfochytrium polystomum]